MGQHDPHPVTPADREAYLHFNALPPADREAVLAGKWDATRGMQILAAHRLAGERTQKARDLIARQAEAHAVKTMMLQRLNDLRATCPHHWADDWEDNVLTGPQKYGRTCTTCGLHEED